MKRVRNRMIENCGERESFALGVEQRRVDAVHAGARYQSDVERHLTPRVVCPPGRNVDAGRKVSRTFIASAASRNISLISGSFGRQAAVVAGRTDQETMKGEPASEAGTCAAKQVADTTSKRLEGVRPATAGRLASGAGDRGNTATSCWTRDGYGRGVRVGPPDFWFARRNRPGTWRESEGRPAA